MEVHRSYNSEYPIGILWNMGNKYSREMMLKIAIMEDVIQVKILDLGEKYEQFVLDCYKDDEEAYDGGYIYDKIKNEYAKKIDGYFFDNLIHISDNIEEAKRTLETVNEYEKFTIGNYIRKGYKAILKGKDDIKNKSYISFLKELRDDNNER